VNTPANTTIRFNEFELDTGLRRVTRAGKEISLNAKAFDLLALLAANPGRLITKAELMETIWAEQFVEENNLTVQMSALRKALAEDRSSPQILRTVPGKGYIFIARVVKPEQEQELSAGSAIDNDVAGNGLYINAPARIDDEELSDIAEVHSSGAKIEPGSAWWFSRYTVVIGLIIAVAAFVYLGFLYFGPRQIGSIAVLPFINTGDDPKTAFLSDGLTESLIGSLSQSPNLKVIARSSVFRYKTSEANANQLDLHTVANELGVQAVLTGRVERHGDELNISVELVDGRDNTHIWGEHYNRNFSDLFVVEQEIASDISKKLRVKLTGEEQKQLAKRYTENIPAFENYYMGRAYIHRRTREDLLTAGRYYEQAVTQDPNYALAYAGLAEVYGNLTVRGYIPIQDGRLKWEDSARRAVQIDDNLAEGHVMLGYFLTGMAPYNFADGDKELRHAIDLSPSLAIAHLYLGLALIRQGEMDDGLAEMLKARELDPFSAIIARQVALYYTLKRDNSRSLEILKQADQLGPSFTATTEIDVYVQNRIYEDALARLDKESQQRKDDPLLIFARGMIYAAEAKRKEAEAAIGDLRAISGDDNRQAQWLAKIYSQLGEKEEALSELDKGIESGSIGAFYKEEPVWDSIRSDPRFNEAVSRIGIPQ
jgi:TolB-like protein/DNA-binding winged helix-turn-helix (wHTH) protein/tetratricopeptide (TPR) repeat protein